IGFWSIFLSVLMFGAMLYYKFLHHPLTGYPNKPFVETPLPLLVVLFFLMGVLAEMVMRTYYESQAKTTYLLGEVRQGPHVPRPS
ncbi:MAG: hypothetical protein JOZ63_07135, partial [Planctomycetaceae bacterium]|nr:hypothetical protein [Planctomycetaceae bacterium]